jgi:hypothetical protein
MPSTCAQKLSDFLRFAVRRPGLSPACLVLGHLCSSTLDRTFGYRLAIRKLAPALCAARHMIKDGIALSMFLTKAL